MEKFLKVIVAAILVFVMCGLIAMLMALPTKLLVNWLLSDSLLVFMFGGKISFMQALGLNWLCGLLFKGSSSTKD